MFDLDQTIHIVVLVEFKPQKRTIKKRKCRKIIGGGNKWDVFVVSFQL